MRHCPRKWILLLCKCLQWEKCFIIYVYPSKHKCIICIRNWHRWLTMDYEARFRFINMQIILTIDQWPWVLFRESLRMATRPPTQTSVPSCPGCHPHHLKSSYWEWPGFSALASQSYSSVMLSSSQCVFSSIGYLTANILYYIYKIREICSQLRLRTSLGSVTKQFFHWQLPVISLPGWSSMH